MSKVLVVIKSMGMGDLSILIPNIHAISKKIGKPITVLAQKNTRAKAILKYDDHVSDIIELDEKEIKGFFNIIKIIKPKKFDKSYIYSDSLRLFLIIKMSGVKEIFHYKFFSKKGKNFFKTAKNFSEKVLNTEIDPQSKIYINNNQKDESARKFNITNKTKNIVCGISASGPTKRWDIKNYIKLFEYINQKFPCKFFLAGGSNDEKLINEIMQSSIKGKCISFAKMTIEETLPIIASCQYYVGNDTGWGHISAGLNLKSLFLFMDSPPQAYGIYSKNISIIVPEGETIMSCSHNTLGKNKISYEKVRKKILELLS